MKQKPKKIVDVEKFLIGPKKNLEKNFWKNFQFFDILGYTGALKK